jgi:hypothetical protein
VDGLQEATQGTCCLPEEVVSALLAGPLVPELHRELCSGVHGRRGVAELVALPAGVFGAIELNQLPVLLVSEGLGPPEQLPNVG